MMNFGESPALDDVLVDYHDRIIYTRLLAGDQTIFGLDTIPERPDNGISGCSVSLNVTSIAETKQIFAALTDGGNIQLPLQAIVWVACFGMLVDRFGRAMNSELQGE
ncbi:MULTISPECIES: VOC family protein [Pseudomonas]|nr:MULTISPECIES: VOC family protein [unclassified Pseudomonas]